MPGIVSNLAGAIEAFVLLSSDVVLSFATRRRYTGDMFTVKKGPRSSFAPFVRQIT